jgi:hypothetical protein
MPRGIKQRTGLNTDFSVTDAAKRLAKNKQDKMKMLDEIGKDDNYIDKTMDDMERANDPVHYLFED